MYKIGDKVRISMPVLGKYNRGVICHRDGGDVYITLNYKSIVVHRYDNEITPIK